MGYTNFTLQLLFFHLCLEIFIYTYLKNVNLHTALHSIQKYIEQYQKVIFTYTPIFAHGLPSDATAALE